MSNSSTIRSSRSLLPGSGEFTFFKSAPAQNARPRPVTATTRTSGSVRHATNCWVNWTTVSRLRAFIAVGRSRVIQPTAPLRICEIVIVAPPLLHSLSMVRTLPLPQKRANPSRRGGTAPRPSSGGGARRRGRQILNASLAADALHARQEPHRTRAAHEHDRRGKRCAALLRQGHRRVGPGLHGRSE